MTKTVREILMEQKKSNQELSLRIMDQKNAEIKDLQDKNFELERKLKNAEDNYLKLLGEYTEYKNQVRDAYRKFEDEERNYNNALGELDKVIMNR